ncbi:uncharacterized protein (DUF305 family) [Streptosporangium becharense]|uniref:Uncharacterized protein (DUF305 family) n=1 Tax=Streptosporangium becharense TaxID=1816182 RepID=A0A7W9MEP1_9ACTN|nr:DUF305 domain-containing protein [Streptosporangium becharense]MBB2910743.1 uncharacterized protein (DUF305 family) [Streptosporangium becharense]MBB5817438.1 uncharacterized protein (DUF305 family) [Streptosporangium becharense]
MFANRSVLRRLALSVTAGAGALALLTACGGGDDAMTGHAGVSSSVPTPTASQSPGASFNDADVMFAQMMIPHHEQAVEMAELAETRAADAKVKELAAKIKAAQDPEIATMTEWLTAWGRPAVPEGGHGGHGMPGMMTEEDMVKLQAAKGAAFDRLFCRLMIAHHKGAIEMAGTEQAQGADPKAKELAKTIETAQQAEIEQMQEILDRL